MMIVVSINMRYNGRHHILHRHDSQQIFFGWPLDLHLPYFSNHFRG